MRYEVNPDSFAINFYNDGDDVPFQFQPDYPNGDKFDSVDEASQWAELSIAAHSDDVNVYAPNGKGLVGQIKPTVQETALLKLSAIGLTPEELKSLLG